MVQLSLISTSEVTLDEQLDRMALRWRDGGAVTATARTATAARFRSWDGRSLDEGERRRVAAYFNAIMRRRLMRSPAADSAQARRRLVAASIEADLVQAGWRTDAARREAQRMSGLGDALIGVA